MGRTLLVSNPKVSWRTWLKENRKERDLITLDPADPTLDFPGRFTLWQGNRPRWTRFYGSLDAGRAPHVILSTLARALPMASENALIQAFAYRPTPLLRQTLHLMAELIQPERILIAAGTPIDTDGFTVGPEEVELEAAFPPVVEAAQRKAQWLKMLEQCSKHEIPFKETNLQGSRLGSGVPLSSDERESLGLKNVVHAERLGPSLLLVSDDESDDNVVARALDVTGCSKAFFNDTTAWNNLLCSFAREGGDDFGMGIIESVDWTNCVIRCLSTAIAPAPVRILRIGSLRVDPMGREFGETKPWQV